MNYMFLFVCVCVPILDNNKQDCTHSSHGNQFVKVVDVDMHKDTEKSLQDLLHHRQVVLGEW